MSSSPLDLPILISQLPYVAKIAHAEKARPEIEQQIFGPLLQKQIQKNEGKVQQVDKKEKTSPVDRDGKRNEQHAQSHNERQQKEIDDDPKTGSSNQSPWSGNIVNVKI